MLKLKRIAPALRLLAVVCLLCIPYTDLRVEREPRALADHRAAAVVEANKPTPVAADIAALESEMAALPMQAILRNLNDDGLNPFYLSMAKLLVLNSEVFNQLVDKLPPLADSPELDRLLRDQLKNEFRKSSGAYGAKPQELLAKIALQVLIERFDKKDQERLLAAEPDLQKKLIEQLLAERLMQANQPLVGMQPQNATYPAAERAMMGAGAAPQPAPPADRRMGDLARMLGAPKSDTPATNTTAAKTAETSQSPAKRFKMADDEDKPVAKAATPATTPSPQNAPMQAQAPVKKSALAPIQNFSAGSFAPSAGPTSGNMMPVQAGYGNGTSSGADGGFGFDVNGGEYGSAVRQRFNYLRANPYLTSNGEGISDQVQEGESEIAFSGESVFSAASGALGAARSSAVTSTGPAFSTPMKLTIGGLCASGALKCNSR